MTKQLSERMRQINELIGGSSKIEMTILRSVYEQFTEKREAIEYFKNSDEVTLTIEPLNQIESKITIEVKNDDGLWVCGECEHWRLKDNKIVCDLTGESIAKVKEYCKDFKQRHI